jgi:tetratricopeptide (TPR) repeat protein
VLLYAKLLNLVHFELDGEIIPGLSGRSCELLVFLATRGEAKTWTELEALGFWQDDLEAAELEPVREFLIVENNSLRLEAGSDVQDFLSAGVNLRTLTSLRGEFAPGLSSSHTGFQAWLERERFELHKVFLKALLENSAGLFDAGRTEEASKNLEFVLRERQKYFEINPEFGAEISLELASFEWRLNHPEKSVEHLQMALPHLQDIKADHVKANLASALIRVGKPKEVIALLEKLPNHIEAKGWALVHLANAYRILDDLEQSVKLALEAFEISSLEQDGFMAVAALTVQGEALLEKAILEGVNPKEAVIAFGKAVGISEVLGEDASAGVLAGLGHAHAVWGSKNKALEVSEKAFKRARAAKDASNTTRALLALYATTKIGSFARNALTEARVAGHKPYELLALLEVSEKEKDLELAREALMIAQKIGSKRLETRASNLIHQLGA